MTLRAAGRPPEAELLLTLQAEVAWFGVASTVSDAVQFSEENSGHFPFATEGSSIMPLEREIAKFDAELPQLLRTMHGQFVLIHGDETAGPFKTEDEAYEAGCAKYGIEPFLVMLVEEHEKPIPMPVDIPPYAHS
jgi:hypothetical protein